MGEAKRRNAQARQVGEALRRRVAAGEFGPGGKASNYCCVVDKSPRGRDMLTALRGMAEFEGLAPLLENEACKFWEASSLFRFIVLCPGALRPGEGIFVAADVDRLVAEALPRAARQLRSRGAPFGVVVGVADEVLDAVLAATGGLQDAVGRDPSAASAGRP